MSRIPSRNDSISVGPFVRMLKNYVASALTGLSLCLFPSKNPCYEGIALHYVIFHHDFSLARNHVGVSYAPVRGLFGINLALGGLISVV